MLSADLPYLNIESSSSATAYSIFESKALRFDGGSIGPLSFLQALEI